MNNFVTFPDLFLVGNIHTGQTNRIYSWNLEKINKSHYMKISPENNYH